MFAGNQTDLELAAHFVLRCRRKKNRIQEHVSHHDDDRSGQKRARNVALRIFYFADDVTGRVPAGVGIHHVNESDRERAAEDRHRIGSVW